MKQVLFGAITIGAILASIAPDGFDRVRAGMTLSQAQYLLGEPISKRDYSLEIIDVEQGCNPVFGGFALDPKHDNVPKVIVPASFKPFDEMFSVKLGFPHFM